MSTIQAPPAGGSGLLPATGFGITVGMWAVGYVARIPPARTPSLLVLFVMLLVIVAGGYLAGRWGGVRSAVLAGLISSLLNMLILGSLLSSGGGVRPSALAWIPGALFAGAALGGLGGWFGASSRSPRKEVDWNSAFVWVGAGATLLLLGAGGLVTSWEAGLAVVDWPNSFGSNMFLYPVSRMTGGIYYEHAHRLFGSLVGLTTVCIAIQLWRVRMATWIRRLGLLAVVMVVVQGVLGGLRVTGRFTLSTDPSEVAPSLGLALVHGVFGQLFFSVLVVLAVSSSRRFAAARPEAHPGARLDRGVSLALVLMLVLQLVLGAIVRHLPGQQFGWGIVLHLTMAGLVAVAAFVVALRAWGVHRRHASLRGLGAAMLWVMPLQLLLGLAALTAVMFRAKDAPPNWVEVLLATLHQVNGALLLALAVALACWTRRLLSGGDTAVLEPRETLLGKGSEG